MPELTQFRQVDFARERATMCRGSLEYSAVTLDTMLHRVYGDAAEEIDFRALQVWASVLRRRMRASRLLLFKTDLLERATDDVTGMDDQALAALPELPTETIIGLEHPRIIKVDLAAVQETRAMSVLVPFSSRDLPTQATVGEHFTTYVSYVRTADQRLLLNRNNQAEMKAFRDLVKHQQVWMPSMVGGADVPVFEKRISLWHLLRAALARGSEPRSTVLPLTVRREGEKAGVKRGHVREVRTVELAPNTEPAPPRESGTEPAWTIQHSFKVKGHHRRYKNAEGEVIKEIWVESYTKGEGLPPMPDQEEVMVARDPDSPRRVYVDTPPGEPHPG